MILVNKAICEKKPPKKSEVQKLQKRNKCIACLKWLNVKHQIWAIAQQKMRGAKRLLGGGNDLDTVLTIVIVKH